MWSFGWDHKKRTCKVQHRKILYQITLSLDSTELLVLILESLWKLLCIILSPFTSYNMEVEVATIQGNMVHETSFFQGIWKENVVLLQNLHLSLSAIKKLPKFSNSTLQLQVVHQYITISELLNSWNFILGEFYWTLRIHSFYWRLCNNEHLTWKSMYFTLNIKGS